MNGPPNTNRREKNVVIRGKVNKNIAALKMEEREF